MVRFSPAHTGSLPPKLPRGFGVKLGLPADILSVQLSVHVSPTSALGPHQGRIRKNAAALLQVQGTTFTVADRFDGMEGMHWRILRKIYTVNVIAFQRLYKQDFARAGAVSPPSGADSAQRAGRVSGKETTL